MKVFSTKIELNRYLSEIRRKGIKIGFVPTMGALHQGHIDLVTKSIEENDYTVVSVYVNKLQFNNETDFVNYPVNREKDIKILENAGCDVTFMPDNDEMFPEGYKKVSLDLGALNQYYEGPMRPGHFDGVVQVVYRLFDYVKPDMAYFGLKDYQQCMVIRILKNVCFPDITLQFCPTTRMSNGLALSSRNERLSEAGIQKAAFIYKTLQTIQDLSKHIEASDAIHYGKHLLKEKGIMTEYLELANADTLLEAKKWQRKGKNILLIAAGVEGVRLIDNIIF